MVVVGWGGRYGAGGQCVSSGLFQWGEQISWGLPEVQMPQKHFLKPGSARSMRMVVEVVLYA